MRRLAALSILLLLTACQAPPPPEPAFTDADREAIASEIEQLSGEMLDLGRPEEVEQQWTYWSPNADSYFVTEPAVFAQSTRILSSMEEVREFFDPSRWNRQRTNITTVSSRVAVLTPESAVQVIQGRFSVTDMAGETGPEYPMSMTGVWVREDGAWKVVHWHQSWSNTPMESETEG
jgi:hypothetical protein